MEVVIFSRSGVKASIRAKVEETLLYSVISKSMLDHMRLSYSPSQQGPAKDSENKVYSPIGEVNLRWHKEDRVKSFAETFYVVDTAVWLVILGKTAIPQVINSRADQIHTLGLGE